MLLPHGENRGPEVKVFKSRMQIFWQKFDTNYLKPFFIRNYLQRIKDIKM